MFKYIRLMTEEGQEVVMEFKDFMECLRIYLQNGAGTLGVKAFAQKKIRSEMEVVMEAEDKAEAELEKVK